MKTKKSNIADNISRRLNVEKQFIEIVIDYMIDEVKLELSKGNNVYLSRLGTFRPKKRGVIKKYDINTQSVKYLDEKILITFDASKKIDDYVNSTKKNNNFVKK